MSAIVIHDASPAQRSNGRWFMLPSEQYPYKREPQIGDVLHLQGVEETVSKDMHTREVTVHLDGIYAVVLVVPGAASDIYPLSKVHGHLGIRDKRAPCFALSVIRETKLPKEAELRKDMVPLTTALLSL